MKKIALIIALAVSCSSAFAYFEEYTSSDIKTLQGVGYSQDLLKMVDTSRMIAQGAEKDYVPFYSRKFYSDNLLIKWYQMAKRYIDPMQDNHLFGVSEVTYENQWFPLSPSYYTPKTPNDKYWRLHEKDTRRLDVAGQTVKGSNGVEAAIDETGIESRGFVYESL